ncbi:methyl-accepting chemotaxis protein [Aquincola tertiaricarbonis]|uniref:methyl-accepting chemotaxis protein n=1 Tax=Aquincola tertiaricarbonis TaxID=391953 RepID=UPI0006150344
MDDITQSGERIADIISTIDGIAFQTNILALNAAVERHTPVSKDAVSRSWLAPLFAAHKPPRRSSP